ncbi:MAG: iron ABC transporter permease [Anaerolineae bacterium]|nr:iron ABC transporter permease [Anaerolineae bacterium]
MFTAATSLLRRWLPVRARHYLGLGAALIVLALLLPLAYLIIRAAGAAPAQWSGLLAPRVLETLSRSLILAVSVTLASIVIGVPLAWLTTRTDLPGRQAWGVLAAVPLAVPSYVGSFALVAMFGPRGLLHELLAVPLGLDEIPAIYGFPGAWLALTLYSYPYVYLTVRATITRLDPALEEAARSLGDPPSRILWRVVIPQLRPAIVSGGLLVGLYALSDFGAVAMLRYTTLTRAIYTQYTASFDRTGAALLALMLVSVTLLILGIEGRLRGRAGRALPRRATRPARVIHLRRWRWPAVVLCAAIPALAIGLPLLVVGMWLAIGLRTGEAFQIAWIGPIWRSVLASGLAALATAACALPLGLLVVRYPSLIARLLDRGGYIGNALPGVVIGLALVFFSATFAGPLYQTTAMLIFAYVVRFLPEALSPIKAALLQVSPHMEEAARGLGRGPLAVLRQITLPLVRSGILSALALVFLTTMKELPVTLMLAPIEFDTLATRIWSATGEAFYGRAAVPMLLLMLVSALSVGFIMTRNDN